jgi:hypothetical protein
MKFLSEICPKFRPWPRLIPTIVPQADKEEMVRKFKSFGANVVFGAEDFCWPDLVICLAF